jgi:hypothetical protein
MDQTRLVLANAARPRPLIGLGLHLAYLALTDRARTMAAFD